MLTIKVKEQIVTDEDGKKSNENFVIVNDIEDRHSQSFNSYDLLSIHVYNEEIIEILLDHSFKEIGSYLSSFQFGEEHEWWESYLSIEVYCNKNFYDKFPMIKINMQLQEWEHWSKPWSMSSLAKEFEREILNLKDSKLQYFQDDPDSMLNGFGVEYYPGDINSIIKPHFEKVWSLLKTAIDETNNRLIQSLNNNAVLTYFKFPDEIKTACEQYLVYFTQFIADMGISVDAELKDELNQTLFKIIPKNKNESLEKIREALDIYLNAPSQQGFQIQLSTQADISAKQWEANVYHFKSQLILANSAMQMKDATIESLQISNYQYRQMLESHQPKKDTEDIIKDVVAVKKYDGKWFDINLPEIFRRLKRKFK